MIHHLNVWFPKDFTSVVPYRNSSIKQSCKEKEQVFTWSNIFLKGARGSMFLSTSHFVHKHHTPNLRWKIPFEVLCGPKPSYDELSVFGCLCFAKEIKQSNKFESRAQKYCFLDICRYTLALRQIKHWKSSRMLFVDF